MTLALERIREWIEALTHNDAGRAEAVLRESPWHAINGVMKIINGVVRACNDAEAGALLLHEAQRSFEPEMCLNNWSRLFERMPPEKSREFLASPERIRVASQLFSFSQAFADRVTNGAVDLIAALTPQNLERTYGFNDYDGPLSEALSRIPSGDDPRPAVLAFQQQEMLRILLRDMLGLADLSQTAGEIAFLAGSIARQAVKLCRMELEERYGEPQWTDEHGNRRCAQYAVIGMGKLGGNELNVSSDLDLIFVYDHEGETTGVESAGQQRRISNHQFFVQLSERFIRFMMAQGGSGKLYRVDARLRPEGASGPLARSLESYENYLLTQARIWEKMSLIKARGIAGETALIQRWEASVRQFVFDANPVQLLLREVLHLKDSIDNEVYHMGLERREVKRGFGGIREIEFQVSATQLIHGKQNLDFRRRSTLDALEVLYRAKRIPQEKYDDLRTAYIWLRTVEHRLQYMHDRQTHVLPEPPGELEALARRCGVEAEGRHKAGEIFQRHHRHIIERVHAWFEEFFGPAQEELEREADQEFWHLLHREIDPKQCQAVLKKYGFRDAGSVKTIRRLAYGASDRYITAEGQQFFERIFPRLMRACSEAPMPDKALLNFEAFLFKSGGITPYYGFIVDYPPVLTMLCKIFGSSGLLSKILIQHPEYLDLLVQEENPDRRIDSPERRATLIKNVLAARVSEIAMNRMRRFYQQNLLRIGMRFLLGITNANEAAAAISDLMRVLLDAAHQRAFAELTARHGAPRTEDGRDAEIVTFGLGKIGARQMSFYSDLDLVYVYDGDGSTHSDESISNNVFFSRLAARVQELFTHPTGEGKIAPIDPRLRPEGKSGPLVVSRQRFESYFESEEAQPWEYQAYLRSALLYGDEKLYRRLRDTYWRRAISLRERIGLARTVREMRDKLEESVKLPSWAERGLKRGPGGIVDIEFLAQYLQLRHGAECGELEGLATDETLRLCAERGYLPLEDSLFLIQALLDLRIVEMTNRLLNESADNYLPQTAERQNALEKALSDHQLTLDGIRNIIEKVRLIFDRFLPQSGLGEH